MLPVAYVSKLVYKFCELWAVAWNEIEWLILGQWAQIYENAGDLNNNNICYVSLFVKHGACVCQYYGIDSKGMHGLIKWISALDESFCSMHPSKRWI